MMLASGEVLIELDCAPLGRNDPRARALSQKTTWELEAAGISPSLQVYTRSDPAVAVLSSFGPYLVPIVQIVIPTLGAILTAWVKAPGRKVMVKIGDMQIEATSVEDVERLISKLKTLQANGEAHSTKPEA